MPRLVTVARHVFAGRRIVMKSSHTGIGYGSARPSRNTLTFGIPMARLHHAKSPQYTCRVPGSFASDAIAPRATLSSLRSSLCSRPMQTTIASTQAMTGIASRATRSAFGSPGRVSCAKSLVPRVSAGATYARPTMPKSAILRAADITRNAKVASTRRSRKRRFPFSAKNTSASSKSGNEPARNDVSVISVGFHSEM